MTLQEKIQASQDGAYELNVQEVVQGMREGLLETLTMRGSRSMHAPEGFLREGETLEVVEETPDFTTYKLVKTA